MNFIDFSLSLFSHFFRKHFYSRNFNQRTIMLQETDLLNLSSSEKRRIITHCKLLLPSARRIVMHRRSSSHSPAVSPEEFEIIADMCDIKDMLHNPSMPVDYCGVNKPGPYYNRYKRSYADSVNEIDDILPSNNKYKSNNPDYIFDGLYKTHKSVYLNYLNDYLKSYVRKNDFRITLLNTKAQAADYWYYDLYINNKLNKGWLIYDFDIKQEPSIPGDKSVSRFYKLKTVCRYLTILSKGLFKRIKRRSTAISRLK